MGRPSYKPIVWWPPVGRQHEGLAAKVENRAGELFPRLGFIVTNLETPRSAMVRFYNGRGTAEQ